MRILKWGAWAGVMGAAWAATVPASAAGEGPDGTATFERPAYKLLRYQEDWSVLAGRDTSQTGDPFDPIKYVPLSDDGEVWASFGGHARVRVENWTHFNFAAVDEDNDTFTLYRMTLHGDLHVGKDLRVFAEGLTAQSTERELQGGRRTIDVDSLELMQAFVDYRLPLCDEVSVTLRGGRQALLFGNQRLVSPLPWTNTFREWDGFSGIVQFNGWSATAFYTQFAPVQKYDFNDPDAQTEFFGLYATGKLPLNGHSADLYWLGLDRDDPVTFNGTTGNEERHTFGARLWGKLGQTAFDYETEAAYQLGEVGDGDVSAYMFAGELGYKFGDWFASPRVHLGLDYASGDDGAGGDVETFNQLFPLGHAYLGYIDTVGRQNIIDVTPGLTLNPTDKLLVKLVGHLFWRAETSDALYNAAGGVVRAGALDNSREVGQELDLLLRYQFDRHFSGEFGYNHFFPGDFLQQSGPAGHIDFVYLMLQYTF